MTSLALALSASASPPHPTTARVGAELAARLLIETILVSSKEHFVAQDWAGSPPIVLVVGAMLILLVVGITIVLVVGATVALSVAPVVIGVLVLPVPLVLVALD